MTIKIITRQPDLRLKYELNIPLLELYHYTKIIVVRPSVRLSVRLSVTEGQRKRFDLETPAAVSRAVERRKLELGDLYERQSWH